MVGHVAVELSRELAPVSIDKLSRHTIIGLTLERLNLLFTLSDQAHGHALDTASRQTWLDLAPQHRRQFKTDDAVQHTTCLLGVYQIEVDAARMLDGLENSGLGNLVENDTARILLGQSQHLKQMPCDSFSLAVFITREPHDIGLGGLVLQLLYLFLLVFRNLIYWFKAVLHVNAEVLLVQVTDVAETRHHFIIISQKLLDGLRLGWRLDNH